MATKKWYEVTQKLSVNDTDKILVWDGTNSRTVELGLIRGIENVTDEYVELVASDGTTYRAMVDGKGELKVVKSEVFTAPDPAPEDNISDKYQALIINQMYGGGDLLSGTAVSHSFIELYNLSKNELNLKGLYLWYKSGTSIWESIPLQGIVPPYSSFLIRGGEHNTIYKDDCRLKIEDYDQEFRDADGNLKRFSNKGMSVYISIGDETPDTNPLRKIKDLQGTAIAQPRYVDLMGCGGTNIESDTVRAFETNFMFGMNKDCACRRVDFYNGGTAKDISGYSNGAGDNAVDCEIIDYSTCEVERYRPRTSKEGNWDMFVSKDPINENAPNAFILGYGEEDTTRTFTWQSKLMPQGYVRYREVNVNAKFTVVKAKTSVLQHPDVTVSKHSCIVKNLQYGKTYEYQVGAEGYWSDLAEFNVADRRNSTIKILWESDEQSWTQEEMNTFRNAFEGIANIWHSESQSTDIKMSEFDFILETGDISQNGRRRNEYYGYFDALQGYNKVKPIMATMGNNDLLNKEFGQCFANFFTNENQWANSVHHYMIGNTEFICLNSNTDYDYVVNRGTLGAGENKEQYQSTDAFLLAQAQWLDNYLTTRTTNPDWTIVYMHLSPFTCVRTKRCQVFVSVFEKHKIPLVLCGHNHLYTRSIPIYSGFPEVTTAGQIPNYNTYYNFTSKATTTYVDEQKAPNVNGGVGINHNADPRNGTYYVMCPATGWKTSGKETHITTFPTTVVDGYDRNVNGHTDGRVWWNEVSNTVKTPGYLTIEVSNAEIQLRFYQIQGAKLIKTYNNVSYEYSPNLEDLNLTRSLIDTLVIRKSDRT